MAAALKFTATLKAFEIVVGYSKVTVSRWDYERQDGFCGLTDYLFTDYICGSSV
jgi:hypothetical protein